MSSTTTEGIRITVSPGFWAGERPEAGHFAFMYTVEIANVGAAPAQLRSRHWVITDANGRVEEVRGRGRGGQAAQPRPGRAVRVPELGDAAHALRLDAGELLLRRPDGSSSRRASASSRSPSRTR